MLAMDSRLSADSVRALDQLRQRLAQLSTGIALLREELSTHTLPSSMQLHSAAQLLSYTLSQYNEAYTSHRKFLTEAHAYPIPTYPGLGEGAGAGRTGLTEEEGRGALEYILRKKLEPRCEAWVDSHVAEHADGDKMRDLWKWAGRESVEFLQDFAEKGVFEADFTIRELEAGVDSVQTGMKRKLEGQVEEESEDEDMDKVVEDVGDEKGAWDGGEPGVEIGVKGLSIEEMLNVLTTAAVHVGADSTGGLRM
nr:mediator of rna polymerase ii transcription subunit 8 [Quercus suber]